jgi:phage terminase large subunit-like protein
MFLYISDFAIFFVSLLYKEKDKCIANTLKIKTMNKKSLEITKKETETKNNDKSKALKIPQTYEEQVMFFREKQNLVKQSEQLKSWQDSINSHVTIIDESGKIDDFTTNMYNLTLSSKGSNDYRNEDIFSINNPVLIKEFLLFISDKMDIKIEALKQELIK